MSGHDFQVTLQILHLEDLTVVPARSCNCLAALDRLPASTAKSVAPISLGNSQGGVLLNLSIHKSSAN